MRDDTVADYSATRHGTLTGPGEPTRPIEPVPIEPAPIEPVPIEPVGARPADQPPVDTPVPEPGGWLGAVRTHLGFAMVLLVAAVGIVRITQYHWRQGAVLLGAALVLAALFRAILPTRRAGLIAVRGRPIDVLSYAGLGGLMVVVAVTIHGGPFG